jgi:hypothetical protein
LELGTESLQKFICLNRKRIEFAYINVKLLHN